MLHENGNSAIIRAMRDPTHLPNSPCDIVPTREGYDRWAEIYDDEDNPLISLEAPQVERLMGDVRGLDVIDIGCGTGRHALRWAAAGARVTAIDFSEGMLAKARARAGAEAVRFLVHDLVAPLPFDDATFGRVACCLVLEHICGLKQLFREFRRICRADGVIVISVMHPAMMLRGITARFTDPATGRETRPAGVRNQICDYVMAAVGAGLSIDGMSEHAVDDALATRSPRARKYLGWPMLLMMRLRPEGRTAT